MNETEILKSIAWFVNNNPNSDIKEKIGCLLGSEKGISFSDAADMMNDIRKKLDIPSSPVPDSDSCKIFAEDFNNAIKIKMADCLIKTPIFYKVKLIEMLNDVLRDISFDKYYVVKKYLESNGYALIDIEAVIRTAETRL